jgi:ABC-2 type transport system permease protein
VDQARLAQAESLATREVVEKAHVGYLVLEPEALQAQTVHYAGRNATSIPDMERLRGAVRQAVMAAQLEAAGARPEMVESITKTRIQMPAERITEKGRGGSGTTSVMLGFGIAFILYLAIILHGQNVLRSVLEEKTTRVAEVVISSVRPHVLLAGKVLGVGLVGLTQQVVWIVASAYLINKFTPLVMKMGGASALAKSGATSGFLMALTGVGFKTLALLLAFFLVGFVFYAALYAAIGAMVNSEQEAQQAAVPVMFLLVGTFLFVQQVMFEPTSTLAVVLSWLPFSSPIIMPLRMTVLQLSPGMIAGSLAVGVLSCGAVVWLAARIYRVGMLMYGKRPSLRELVKWVRYA